MSTLQPAGVGIDHLTLLGLTPPELVAVAAETGYAYVGLRVRPATSGERGYPMAPGSPMLTETVRLLESTGVRVLDTEALTLDGNVGPTDWIPALQSSAELGSRFLNVIVADADPLRASETLARLVEDAHPYGVRPSVEPITYRAVNSLPAAAALARAVGAGVVIDALHYTRFGGTPEEVRALGDLLSFVQLCDGPLAAPTGLRPPARMPLGQSIEGTDLQVESRAIRELPGEGEFAIADLLAALPEGTPLTVEAPHVARAESMGSRAYAARALAAVHEMLRRIP